MGAGLDLAYARGTNGVMAFRKGIHYHHPPRGSARKPYNMTELALTARRTNIAKVRRVRSHSESRVIKLFVY